MTGTAGGMAEILGNVRTKDRTLRNLDNEKASGRGGGESEAG